MNSFHALMKANSAVTASAGLTAGSATFQKASARVAPSTIAASSRSIGTVSKAPRIWKMANGTALEAYTKTRPARESRRCSASSRRYSGTALATAGNICVARSVRMPHDFPTKRNRASA